MRAKKKHKKKQALKSAPAAALQRREVSQLTTFKPARGLVSSPVC